MDLKWDNVLSRPYRQPDECTSCRSRSEADEGQKWARSSELKNPKDAKSTWRKSSKPQKPLQPKPLYRYRKQLRVAHRSIRHIHNAKKELQRRHHIHQRFQVASVSGVPLQRTSRNSINGCVSTRWPGQKITRSTIGSDSKIWYKSHNSKIKWWDGPGKKLENIPRQISTNLGRYTSAFGLLNANTGYKADNHRNV